MTQEMEEFLKAYGTEGLGLLVEAFVRRAPEFEGDQKLSAELGVGFGMLQNALEAETRREK